MRIPSDTEIRALHEKHAPTAEVFDRVYTHCQIVAEIAEQFTAQDPALDQDLVRAGCLLHDIGVYRLYDRDGRLGGAAPYIAHGFLGHELLREEGFDEGLCRFSSCHTGVGLTRDDVRKQNLPIPEADYVAESAEEEVVMYADKFHSKSIPARFYRAETYARKARQFGADKEAGFKELRARYGDPDLTRLRARYGHDLI